MNVLSPMFVLLIVECKLEILILILSNVKLESVYCYEIDQRDKYKRRQSMMDLILNRLYERQKKVMLIVKEIETNLADLPNSKACFRNCFICDSVIEFKPCFKHKC